MSTIVVAGIGILLLILLAGFAGGAVMLNMQNKKVRQDSEKKERAKQEYQANKKEVFQEVFGNAEKKKAELSSGNDARARFDAINNSLRNNSGGSKTGNP
jgi:hypothetical protein